MLEIEHKSSGKILKIYEFWLRDHCRCEDCYVSATKQRRYNLLDIPADVQPVERRYTNDGRHYEVKWSDGHCSSYDIDFLYKSQVEQVIESERSPQLKTPWDCATIRRHEGELHVPLTELIQSEAKVKEIVTALIRYGIAFIEGVPPTTAMTEMAIRRLFPIMKTFFGEMFSLTDAPTHADSAYSSEFLGSHTDNTYFCDAAGLHSLHCTKHVGGSGGESFFVDGLHCAMELQKRNPHAFDVLATVHVPGEYIEEGQHHKHSAPMIRVDPVTGTIQQLRLNVYDRAVMDTIPQDRMQDFYQSFREFLEIVQSESNRWTLKLLPGTFVIFDNWRVYHGRHSYTGHRSMTGAYIQRTDFMSKARILGIID